MACRSQFSETGGVDPECYHSCQWSITPQAKDIITSRFSIALDNEGLSAQLSYDYDEFVFKISNLTGDPSHVCNLLDKIINRFLQEELGEIPEHGDRESNLASKVPLSSRRNENDVTTATKDILIEGFVQAEWSCSKIEQLVEGVFYQKILRQIGEITECTLHYNSETRKIVIIGPFLEACHQTTLKLDKIRDYYVPLFKNPFINRTHCFWAEKHEEFMLMLVPLKSIHKLYETTILDISKYPTDSNCYQVLSRGGKLRCGLYDQARRGYRPTSMRQPEPAVNALKREGKFGLFRDYKYAAKGEERDDPMNIVNLSEHQFLAQTAFGIPFERTAGIEDWLKEVNEMATLDSDLEENLLVSALEKCYTDTAMMGDVCLDLESTLRNIRDLSIGNSQPPASNFDLYRHLTQAPQRNNAAPQNQSLLDGDINDELPLTLQPMFADKPPTTSFPTRGTTPTEILQTKAEVDTRSFHHTMGQRAAKGQWIGDSFIRATPPTDITATFLASVQASTTATINILRGYRGPVTLRAVFGRAWIHHQPSTDTRHMSWANEDVLRHKLGELDNMRPIVDMTDLLTTEPADMEFLLDMPLFGGQKGAFWKRTPKWEVSYQFQCHDLSPLRKRYVDEEFMVTVDAENFSHRVHTLRRSLGETYVHCLNRVWDFRISATGTTDLVDEYGDVGSELVRTLYIPPDTDDSTLTLSFSLPSHHVLSFPTVRVAKKCTYTSTATGTNNVKLHVTEIHDLHIERLNIPPADGSIVYRACARVGEEESHQEVRWFEVGLSSEAGDEMLSVNEDLEVGGEAGWKSGEFRGVVEGLTRTACEVVKGIEGVGGWNENPFGGLLRAEDKKNEEERRKGKGT